MRAKATATEAQRPIQQLPPTPCAPPPNCPRRAHQRLLPRRRQHANQHPRRRQRQHEHPRRRRQSGCPAGPVPEQTVNCHVYRRILRRRNRGIIVGDADPSQVDALLRYAYLCEVEDTPTVKLLRCAHRYQITSLLLSESSVSKLPGCKVGTY